MTVKELQNQIDEMKLDVKRNIKWANFNSNEPIYFKLNSMNNQWENEI